MRKLVTALAVPVLALAVAAPVGATQYSRERFEWADSWSYDWCGPVIDVVSEGGDTISIRTGKGPDDDAFFAHDGFWFKEQHRRRSDGKMATVEGHGQYVETTATRVDGSVFEFESIVAGQPFTVRDAEGGLILRDRGSIREVITFDTLGDDTPGGELVAQVSSILDGKFPGLTTDLFCEYWND